VEIIIVIAILLVPMIIVIGDFWVYIKNGKELKYKVITRMIELFFVVFVPILYLIVVDGPINDCCSESATFSPPHKLTIYFLTGICILAYSYSTLKSKIHSPLLEVFTNSMLLYGVIFNIFLLVQIDFEYAFFGNLPVLLLFLIQLAKNQFKFLKYNENPKLAGQSKIEHLAWKLLNLKVIYKIPILLIILIPILTVLAGILLIFGQKPDSAIRAFTDTYYHGFSQLDYMCNNVDCGGHFLCSVAAGGHKSVVQPIRLGERNGGTIVCNRQLLISNAFEDLIQDKFPKIHYKIRKNYNKVGNIVHQYYSIFNNKLVADFIYILMKPAEWFFLLVLYTFDRRPENRIAKQYLAPNLRDFIDEKIINRNR